MNVIIRYASRAQKLCQILHLEINHQTGLNYCLNPNRNRYLLVAAVCTTIHCRLLYFIFCASYSYVVAVKTSGVTSYGALGHVPRSASNNFILVHFRVNLTAKYLSIV